jgi:hypothetical protein
MAGFTNNGDRPNGWVAAQCRPDPNNLSFIGKPIFSLLHDYRARKHARRRQNERRQ